MFDYPIPPLQYGQYADLDLGPEATAEEINEARQELTTSLRTRQRIVQRNLDAVYQQVPGLRQASEKLKSLEDASTEVNEYRQVQLKLAELQEKAMQIEPRFKQIRDELDELRCRIHEVHLMPIQNPEERIEYDRNHPPLDLIKLADCGASPLEDPETMLRMLRLELSDFLEQAGEIVFHPSDLTRNDFSHDFSHNRNLDRD